MLEPNGSAKGRTRYRSDARNILGPSWALSDLSARDKLADLVSDRAVRLTVVLSPGRLVRCVRLSVTAALIVPRQLATETLSKPAKRSKKSWGDSVLGAFDCQ